MLRYVPQRPNRGMADSEAKKGLSTNLNTASIEPKKKRKEKGRNYVNTYTSRVGHEPISFSGNQRFKGIKASESTLRMHHVSS